MLPHRTAGAHEQHHSTDDLKLLVAQGRGAGSQLFGLPAVAVSQFLKQSLYLSVAYGYSVLLLKQPGYGRGTKAYPVKVRVGGTAGLMGFYERSQQRFSIKGYRLFFSGRPRIFVAGRAAGP